jgi:hypothetical protein
MEEIILFYENMRCLSINMRYIMDAVIIQILQT